MIAFLEQYLKDFRRDLHKYPEAGWMEFRTTCKIVSALQEAGIPVHFGKQLHCPEHMLGMPSRDALENAWKQAFKFADDPQVLEAIRGGFTGCVAEIVGALPGKTTVFRVDIDACELQESDDQKHLPMAQGYVSQNPCCMHACGHDAHAAIGVGAAKLLWQRRNELHGTVRILFQPAEEGLRGAASMVAAGLLNQVDQLIGLHVGIRDLSFGTVAVRCTNFLSSTKLDATFYGKAVHAGICPEQGRNALAAGAKATLELLDLPKQFEGVNRVNVGTFHAGSGRNVIPARAHLAIETRADSPLRNKQLSAAAEMICCRAASMYGCSVEFTCMGGSDAAACDESLASDIAASLTCVPQIENILPCVSFGGGEDVTTMMQAVQQHGGRATELLIGMPLVAPHHSDRFDVDERVLLLGAQMLERIALSLG